MTFDECFLNTVGSEGGYVNDPKDPGGETKFGISKKAFPELDIANLTLDDAKVIYKKKYWDFFQMSSVPEELRYSVFDAAVNNGSLRAKYWLERSNGSVAKFNGLRLAYMADLPTWPDFGKGWSRRIAKILQS
jgi:lysozyme family protein